MHTASGSNHPLPPLTTSASAPPGGAASSSIYQSSSAAAAGAAGAKISAVETSDLVGLNWRDKNYMGVVRLGVFGSGVCVRGCRWFGAHPPSIRSS